MTMLSSQHAQKFIELYQKLDKNNLALLTSIYHPDIQFIDPLHEINGLDQLKAYFANLYQNINSIEFEIHQRFEVNNHLILYWQMTFSHPKLKSGKSIIVEGNSQIEFHNGLVTFHRDYFDTNAMLFEHIPLIGSLIRYIKSRVNK